MSDATVQSTGDRRKDRVVWPDPSPLAPWWDRVMSTENASAQSVDRWAR